MKNPLNADENITDLADELAKEGSDAKTVAKLYSKIIAKGTATGLLISTGILAFGATVIVVASALTKKDEETESEDEELED